MKKLTLSLLILGVTTFFACSADDGVTDCVVCTYSQQQENDVIDVCNVGGNATSDGYDTQTEFEQYIIGLEGNGYVCD